MRNNDITDLSNLSKDSLSIDFMNGGVLDLTGNTNINTQKIIDVLLDIHDITSNMNGVVSFDDFFKYTDKVIVDEGFPEYQYDLVSEDTIEIDMLNHVIIPKKVGEVNVNLNCGEVSKSFSVTVRDDELEIPDDYLRDILLSYCDSNNDGIIGKKEIESFDGLISVPFDETHVLDLTGLECAINLRGFIYNATDNTRAEVHNYDILGQLKNLEMLSLRNIELNNISFLENLINITELDLSNTGIKDILVVKELKKLEKLTLNDNMINSITSLKGLEKLTTLSLSNNEIEDISPIVDLNLANVDLSDNKIASIPKWTNYGVLINLTLNGNPLKDIYNLKEMVNYGNVIIYAENTGLKPEDIFIDIYDVQDTNVYQGNFIRLDNSVPVVVDEKSQIVFVCDNDGLKQIENNFFQGIRTGIFNVEVRCGEAVKEFKVNVLEAEKPVEIKTTNIPVLDIVNSNVCVSMDTDKTLWSINSGKYEKVAEHVNSYYSYDKYSKNKTEFWADYVVLDDKCNLWNCQKKDYNKTYENTKIAKNVLEFNEYFYLTKQNELYNINDNSLVAENVASYHMLFDWDGLCTVQYVFTVDGKVIDILNNKVIAENIKGECVLKEKEYVNLTGYRAIWYNYSGKEIGRIDGVLSVEDEFINMMDGTQCDYTAYEDKVIFSQRCSNMPRLPIKESITDFETGTSYYLDGNNVLWTAADSQQETYEIMAEDVKSLCRVWEGTESNLIQKRAYLKDGSMIELETGKEILSGIKKIIFNAYSYFYLSEDGKVYDNTNIGYVSCILSDVEDFITQSNGAYVNRGVVYLVRRDGSIWQYNYNAGDGKAIMIKSGQSIGDLDGDGYIKIKDMMTMLHFLSGSAVATEEQKLLGDLDKDGEITIKDMLRMMHYISGSSSSL